MFNVIISFCVGVLVALSGVTIYEDYQNWKRVDDMVPRAFVTSDTFVRITDMRPYQVHIEGRMTEPDYDTHYVQCVPHWNNTARQAAIELDIFRSDGKEKTDKLIEIQLEVDISNLLRKDTSRCSLRMAHITVLRS